MIFPLLLWKKKNSSVEKCFSKITGGKDIQSINTPVDRQTLAISGVSPFFHKFFFYGSFLLTNIYFISF